MMPGGRNQPTLSLTRRDLMAAVATAWASRCAAPRVGVAQRPRPDAGRAAVFADFYTPQARLAVQRGLDYLAARQNEDGSFGTGAYGRNVAVCGLCGMALLASGSTPGRGPYGGSLVKVVDFILNACQESGFIHVPEAASRGPMYGHGFSTLFLAEVYGMSRDPRLRPRLSKAVELILQSQNEEGGWRYEPRRDDADVSVTVSQLMALRAARNAGLYVPNQTVNDALNYVKRCQNADGGFMYMAGLGGPSEFPRSAAALVALYGGGIYEGDEVQRALDYLMRHPPRANALGRQGYFMYGHYYAAQAMWIAGGNHWQTWYPAIRDVLLAQQREDGSWFDVISLEYGTAMACLVLQMPENFLPIFRR